MRGERYLGRDGLPPKPDTMSGLPRPPHAPGRSSKATRKGSFDRDDALTGAPAPPQDQGPVLAWYCGSRSYAVRIGVLGFLVTAFLLSVRDSFQFHWVKYWWAWLILVLAGFLIGLTQRKGSECSAGVEWVRGRKAWVRTYELTKVKLSVGLGNFHLSMRDRDGRSTSLAVSALQEDRLMWDLVYNGVLHSVIANGAETNGQLHRYMRVPYPSPYDATRQEINNWAYTRVRSSSSTDMWATERETIDQIQRHYQSVWEHLRAYSSLCWWAVRLYVRAATS